jgi:hypothetical protein
MEARNGLIGRAELGERVQTAAATLGQNPTFQHRLESVVVDARQGEGGLVANRLQTLAERIGRPEIANVLPGAQGIQEFEGLMADINRLPVRGAGEAVVLRDIMSVFDPELWRDAWRRAAPIVEEGAETAKTLAIKGSMLAMQAVEALEKVSGALGASLAVYGAWNVMEAFSGENTPSEAQITVFGLALAIGLFDDAGATAKADLVGDWEYFSTFMESYQSYGMSPLQRDFSKFLGPPPKK